MAIRRASLDAQKVKKFLPKARPGNFAWREVERLTGLDGDYLPTDSGEPPTNNEEGYAI